MRRNYLLLVLLFLLQDLSAQIAVTNFATGITGLTDIASCGDNRIFALQKTGIITAFDSAGNALPGPFLNITGRVNPVGLEKGILGLVFADDYLSSGYFYVYYVAKPGNDSRISRFRVSSNPALADSTSEQLIITIPQPVGSHFGGDMAFGPDGYLYLGLGDGGGEGDPSNHAQDTSLLLGKFIRIDVSDVSSPGYTNPPDNPFINSPFPDEVWSIGFRNPWRWSFDRMTGDMWIGDVGQGAKEEVDLQSHVSHGGENYGWRCYEGTIPYVTTNCAPQSSYVDPVYEYSHGNGCSVTGGYVYRGSSYHSMFGKYFFSDWCSPTLRMLTKVGGTYVDSTFSFALASGPIAFGEDRWGELYIGLYNGTILKMVDSTAHHVAWISDEDTMNVCSSTFPVLRTPAGNNFHYHWFFNGSPVGSDTNIFECSQPGNYFVTVQNSFGLPQTSDTVVVNFVPPPTVTMTTLDTLYCLSDPAVPLFASPLGGVLKINGHAQSAFVFDPSLLGPGTYIVEYSYTDPQNCNNTVVQSVSVDACNSVSDILKEDRLAYPVPSSGVVYIRADEIISVYNLQGEKMEVDISGKGEIFTLDIGELPAGFYFCTVSDNGMVRNIKWLKQ